MVRDKVGATQSGSSDWDLARARDVLQARTRRQSRPSFPSLLTTWALRVPGAQASGHWFDAIYITEDYTCGFSA